MLCVGPNFITVNWHRNIRNIHVVRDAVKDHHSLLTLCALRFTDKAPKDIER